MSYDLANLVIQALIAIGAVGALFAALHQIRKNKEQRDEEQTGRIELKARAQADNVAAWFGEGALPGYDMGDMGPYVPEEATVHNGNALPIYNVVVSVVGVQGAGYRSRGEENEESYPCRLLFHTVLPGSWGAMIRTCGHGMHAVSALEVAFTDTMGQSWVRRGSGILEKLDTTPLEWYRIPLPPSWSKSLRVKSGAAK